MRQWLNAHVICFVSGLALLGIGLYGIYWPLAAASVGVILMAIAVFGSRKVAPK